MANAENKKVKRPAKTENPNSVWRVPRKAGSKGRKMANRSKTAPGDRPKRKEILAVQSAITVLALADRATVSIGVARCAISRTVATRIGFGIFAT